jgi:sodium-dependent dicarboxylate transporter 2/3/5
MMLPISLSVVEILMRGNGESPDAGSRNFATCMMLGLAYAASIGGVSTIIGTPPNAVFAGYIRNAYDIEIGFAQWMMVALPIAIMMLIAAWATLLLLYPNRMGHIEGADRIIHYELTKLGAWSPAEKRVAVIFFSTAMLWVFRGPINQLFPALNLNDAGIAMAGAIALFVVPLSFRSGEMLLTWREAERLPWGILLLFGGGLCLASAVRESQLAEWIGMRIQSVVDVSEFALILLIAGVIKLLTEFMSNVATITTFLPVIAALAVAFGYPPIDLMVPATLAASFAFMTPVATPPNAVVFASGHVKMKNMVFTGFWLNLIAWVISPAFCYYMMDYAFK